MIELPDLFHENRVQELSLSFILYAPIGLCLVLIRSIALLFLFVISSIFPASQSFDQLIIDAISLILTFTYDNESPNERKDNRRTTKIIVANRVSLLDGVFLRRFFYNTNCKLVNIWKDHSCINWFKLNTIDYSRNQEELFDLCIRDIERPDSQLIFLPECEPTTGTDGLLKFNPYTKYHLNFLPIVSSEASSSNEILCERVRENISEKMSIPLTKFDENDVTELRKRPEFLQRRHAQRRAEFQQMINLVHQQVPIASLEAIRYDLEMTKNIQRTIANLNERAAAATPTSSRAMSNSSSSSSSSSHRQTYERLKQELIEKNRQLFLNKNCN
ncbi:hypothetical protein I4U23_029951 [Adineta vaga]|nr:hypothetical protein I4U23_029951 [Adineta vaga]